MSDNSIFTPLIDGIKIWLNDFQQLAYFLKDSATSWTTAGWDGMVYLYNTYAYLNSFADPKLRDWPLMGGPCTPMFVLLIYFTIIHHGQSFIHSPPPSKGRRGHGHGHIFDLGHLVNRPFFTYLLVLYNAAMATLNAWIAYELIYCGLMRQYNFLCQLVYTKTDDPYETRIAEAIWWYFASKGFELMDTVFIILKRKPGQLTFLHMYHHSSMFAVWWVAAKFVPGGSALTAALVNCVVHIAMYGYYALSAMGPKLKPYLWWKKYLTIIQLIQFTLGVSLGLNSIISSCPFTRWMQYVFVAYAFSFLVLFGNFYRRTYMESRRKSDSRGGGGGSIHKSPNNRDLATFFASSPSNGSGSSSSESSSAPGKKTGRHLKQSKLSMLNAKHNYGQIGRRKKVKSG